MDVSWNYTIYLLIDTVDQPLKAPTIASDTTADDERDVHKLTTKFGSSLTSEGKNLNF